MKVLKRLIRFLIILIIIFIAAITWYGYKFYKETTDRTPIATKVNEIREKSDYVKIDDLPDYYTNAVVSVEDRRFYKHGAVDYIGILRAIFFNIKNKTLQEGGSTITQQVAKNLYFEEEQSVIKRKVAEAFIAIDLEKQYSKKEILELYTNIIYFGDGYYGISSACNGYLKKSPTEMTLAEATMMAGVPNAPYYYAPTANKELCKKRQQKVISTMVKNKFITQETADNIDSSFIDKIN